MPIPFEASPEPWCQQTLLPCSTQGRPVFGTIFRKLIEKTMTAHEEQELKSLALKTSIHDLDDTYSEDFSGQYIAWGTVLAKLLLLYINTGGTIPSAVTIVPMAPVNPAIIFPGRMATIAHQ